ncbi:DUF3122 domain-containing protein [Prochlorothrix hollandica]|uniref:DUF3122 domain-containing protein n=1 Tax=Prochlorothrix hollandica TaxID=1223 RepID=UPI00034D4EAF|nr:DUF3122 domain-containing protein [Prochlorothrix hollandica]
MIQFSPQRSQSRFWLWLGALALMLTTALGAPPPAQASIQAYPEGDRQILYRSQQSIRDDRDQAWQAVFFKRMTETETTALHLRLVGFPGMGYPARARSLRVVTGPEQEWEFPNVSHQEVNLTDNAGQYDLNRFMAEESRDLPLKLYLSIRNSRFPAVLTVPPYVVQEWRQVTQAFPDQFPQYAAPAVESDQRTATGHQGHYENHYPV